MESHRQQVRQLQHHLRVARQVGGPGFHLATLNQPPDGSQNGAQQQALHYRVGQHEASPGHNRARLLVTQTARAGVIVVVAVSVCEGTLALLAAGCLQGGQRGGLTT